MLNYTVIIVQPELFDQAVLYRLNRYLNLLGSFKVEHCNAVAMGDAPNSDIGFLPDKYAEKVISGLDHVCDDSIKIVVTPQPISSDSRIIEVADRIWIASSRGLSSTGDYTAVTLFTFAICIRLSNDQFNNLQTHNDCIIAPRYTEGLPESICKECCGKTRDAGLFAKTLASKIYQGSIDGDNGHHVIITHGIHSFAPWAKPLKKTLQSYGFSCETAKYGWYSAVKLFLHRFFSAGPREILEEAMKTAKIQKPNRFFSVIAHSNGTLVVRDVLEQNDNIKIENLVLVGSILKSSFDWSPMINSGKVSRVLNVMGSKDIWPSIVECWIWGDVGDSGSVGFNSDSELVQNVFLSHGHGGSLRDKKFIENELVPFLSSTNHYIDSPLESRTKRVEFLSRVLTKKGLLIFVVIVVVVCFRYLT